MAVGKHKDDFVKVPFEFRFLQLTIAILRKCKAGETLDDEEKKVLAVATDTMSHAAVTFLRG